MKHRIYHGGEAGSQISRVIKFFAPGNIYYVNKLPKKEDKSRCLMNGNYGVDYFNKNQRLIKKQKPSYTIEGALEPNSQHGQALSSFQNGTLNTVTGYSTCRILPKVYFNPPSNTD